MIVVDASAVIELLLRTPAGRQIEARLFDRPAPLHAPLLTRMWALRSNLTAHDAAYVALAEALGAVLVTRDTRLGRVPGLHATVEVLA